ncbi:MULTISPECIES: PD40 domain-containing protein [Asticcacaulis]|uniref:TolB family protein n=1 Tax=Asticcacaulis TaxID=76890 RepID=UPI001AE1DFE7|nr:MULTISPECIES: PD40 domain-containing protein [Asticcacaulis]MBP2158305.1 hypothetical protein [Asticcacaulis solisilvae]MDR6799350.1 hypothetical protein [Asticcacaulis sp. BE141]
MIRHILTCAAVCVMAAPAFAAEPVTFDGIALGDLKPRAPVYSKGGDLLLFTAGNPPQIYESRRISGTWSAPVVAGFSNEGRNWEPFLTPDGKTVIFVSSRAPGDVNRGRAFKSMRTRDDWSKPEPLFLLDDPAGIWFPNGEPAGLIYFSGDLKDQAGKSDLYVFDMRRPEAGPQRLADLSSPGIEWDPYVSPDGQWMVFVSDRPGGQGRGDLWLSRRQTDGTWGTPVNAGPKVNTGAYEVAAVFSPDGKTLYFVREPDQVFAVPFAEVAP